MQTMCDFGVAYGSDQHTRLQAMHPEFNVTKEWNLAVGRRAEWRGEDWPPAQTIHIVLKGVE
jgi:hypothetical protein